MESHYYIRGKFTPAQRTQRIVEFQEYIKGLSKPVQGEEKKKFQYRQMIDLANQGYRKELVSLGLPPRKLDPNMVHFVNGDIIEAQNGYRVPGYEDLSTAQVFVNTDFSLSEIYYALLHEGVHALAHHRYYDDNSFRRSGYRMNNEYQIADNLNGFNEEVTDKITQDIYNTQIQTLRQTFPSMRSEQLVEGGNYDPGKSILDSIINGIARGNNEKPEDVWSRIKRGNFTGSIMHLKDIERIFGVGSLRVLSAFKNVRDEESHRLVKLYFDSQDDMVKRKVANKVLTDFDRKRYNDRRRFSYPLNQRNAA